MEYKDTSCAGPKMMLPIGISCKVKSALPFQLRREGNHSSLKYPPNLIHLRLLLSEVGHFVIKALLM